jgi:DNA-binding transcriptional regulator YiaG
MKKYKDDISKTVHQMAEGFYKIGAIDTARMCEYDADCLVPKAVPHRDAAPSPSVILPSGDVAGARAQA